MGWALNGRVLPALIVMCASALPAASQISARLEPDSVRPGEPFLLRVEARGGDVDEPEVPTVDGLQLSKQPRVRNDLITIVNFSKERTKVRGYMGRAARTGTFTIPPVKARIDGRVHESEALVLTVTDSPGPSPAERPQQNGPAAPPGEPSGEGDTPPFVILDAHVDKTEAYINEPIILTLQRWILDHRQVAIRGAESADPTTEGFYAIPVSRQRSPFDSNLVERDGFYYQYDEAVRILYPTTDGELAVGSWSFEGVASVRDGFQSYRRDILESTPQITITVRSLPPAPAGFTGGVGQFAVAADVTETAVVQGVPTMLRVRISGVGNPDAIGAPELPKTEGGTVTAPVSDIQWDAGDEMPRFTKTFTYGVTLVTAGEVAVPAFRFCYFDPEAEMYRTEELGPFMVTVQAADSGQSRVLVDANQGEAHGNVDVVGEDIRPIITSLAGPTELPSAPMTALAVGMPPVAFAAWALGVRRRRRYMEDVPFARSRRAKSVARKRLESLRHASDPQDVIYRSLADYVSDKLGLERGGITSDDVRTRLADFGFEDGLVNGVVRVLRTIERARYGSTPLSDVEIRALADAAREQIETMDRTFIEREDNHRFGRLRLRGLLHSGMRSGAGVLPGDKGRRSAP